MVPLTVAVEPAKASVQPLDENAFTVTLRNPNATALPVGTLTVDSGTAWDYTPGTSTGLATADPGLAAGKLTWSGPWTIAGHGGGEQRFGVSHRNGTRVAVTTATPAHETTAFAGVTSTAIADIASATAAVDVRPIEGSVPNTAIFGGPDGLGTDPEPRFTLVASKDEGISYECRFAPGDLTIATVTTAPARWPTAPISSRCARTTGSGPTRTPASDIIAIDTLAPNTVIVSGPAKVTTDTRPRFELRANEPGSSFECRFRDAVFTPCAASVQAPDLADGDHRFQARARDRAGNVDATPAEWEFRVDTAAPVTTSTAPPMARASGSCAPARRRARRRRGRRSRSARTAPQA